MPIDFNKLSRPKSDSAPQDPIEIFRGRPSGDDAVSALWTAQGETLKRWFHSKNRSDVLIQLNTGAGKTLIGLLIAQSLHNAGKENAVYVCANNDLVEQTALEAKRLGLDYTTRISGKFSNAKFELGESICITNYQSVINKITAFKNELSPAAIVFDDAHVAESIFRDSVTLKVSAVEHPNFHSEIMGWIHRGCRVGGLADRLSGATSSPPTSGPFLAPPIYIYDHAEELKSIIKRNMNRNKPDIFFPYLQIIEHIGLCSIVIHGQNIEVSPPFIPAKQFPALAKREVERVYLSATLTSQSDFARAFGRKPSDIVREDDDAGNGERLVLYGLNSKKDAVKNAAARLREGGTKVLIAVPSRNRAKNWRDIADLPEPSEFTAKLNAFRKASTGTFLLAGRFDGIDLPDHQCRVMVIDGVPATASLVEGYQYETLGFRKSFVNRTASRLTQLFGRINRGRKDYGVFLVNDRATSIWLQNRRHQPYFPPVLRQQLKLGSEIHKSQNDAFDTTDILETANQVLDRDEGWQNYYRDHLSAVEIDGALKAEVEGDEQVYLKAAKAESNFMSAVWASDFVGARQCLAGGVDELTTVDASLGGWHYLWMGMACHASGEPKAARRYFREAHSRLGVALPVPRSVYEFQAEAGSPPKTAIESGLRKHLGDEIIEVERRITRLEDTISIILDATKSHKQHEEGVRVLGELLGFRSIRPDKADEIGPDNLWLDELNGAIYSIELKTEKKLDGELSKSEIGQSHNHIAWVEENYAISGAFRHFIVSPTTSVSRKASLGEKMEVVETSSLQCLVGDFISVLNSLKVEAPATQLELVEASHSRLDFYLGSTSLIRP